MINKILKVELFTLFLFTLIAFFAFYYQSVLPDNFFSISSESQSVNFLSYYFTTLIATVGFYTGPWIFLPFMMFSCFYTIKFSKREFLGDSFLVISLLVLFMSSSFVFFPSLLGEGLFHVLKAEMSILWAVIFSICSFILFLMGSFRTTFKKQGLVCYEFLLSIPEKLRQNTKRKHSQFGIEERTDKGKVFFEKLKLSIPRYLKGMKKEKDQDRTHNELPLIAVEKNNHINRENINKEENYKQKNFFQESLKEDVLVRAEREIVADESKGPLVSQTYLKNNSSEESEQKYKEILSNVKLQAKSKNNIHPDDQYFDEIIDLIEGKLSEFKIDGRIINILKGPVVDTFELELGPGVKVSKVTGASQDLSLALYGAPIRIVYPMKGRTTIGIEVPRNPREIIYLDELIDSEEFQSATHDLPVALGKDAFGEPCIVDLAKMPHMLVAGATGAGKSVFINAIILSLLLKKSPKQMQLILIDPKQLELALYSNLPHLAMPIVTDAKTASIALLWATQEMQRRYSILKDFGVRNISGFNEKLKVSTPAMLAKIHQHYENFPENEYELPYLVIVIDEFADLILTKAGKEIECNVARLAAKARAAGIHIVLATQRPSVDVITGVIKSNFPTRISFRVSSPIDSRTILDKMGAEMLLGMGDMLYKHGIETIRVHSSFVDEGEIEVISNELEKIEGSFNDQVIDFLENGGEEVQADEYTYGSNIPSSNDDNSTDKMFKEAVRVCAEQGSASASMLQRRLKIGYNRAANLIDELHGQGYVGPTQGSKPREVLIRPESMD